MTTSRVEFTEMTAELVHAFYGGPPPFTMRGYVAMLDGRPVGLGGIHYYDGVPFAFTEMTDELRARRRDKARCFRKLEPLLRQFGGVLYAVACEPTSLPMLKRLGFFDTGAKSNDARAAGPVLARI